MQPRRRDEDSLSASTQPVLHPLDVLLRALFHHESGVLKVRPAYMTAQPRPAVYHANHSLGELVGQVDERAGWTDGGEDGRGEGVPGSRGREAKLTRLATVVRLSF